MKLFEESTISREDENIFTVTEITKHINNILQSNIPTLWVKGEISNYKRHSSGHIYFTLKDEQSSLLCVFFHQYNQYLRFEPENGMEVICFGQIKVYERSGQYQLYVNQIRPLGIGDLEIAFRKLKEKLEDEGLFDEKWKKPIPEFPTSIGIVTSPTGAAIQDIKNVITRRFPVKIILYPAKVQGPNAALEITSGIKTFNKLKNVDVIIVGRGGGSIEDLWAFNEETVARAIFESEIPIISAVGHEVDFTISDFVADLRAPTPSAAAELVVPDRESVQNGIDTFSQRLTSLMQNELQYQRSKCTELKLRLEKSHPRNLLLNYLQQIDELHFRLKDSLQKFVNYRLILEQLKIKFSQTFRISYIEKPKKNLMHYGDILFRLILKNLSDKHDKFLNLTAKLEELNPLKILKRGYSITKKDKKIINSIKKLRINDKISVHFVDGECGCEVEKINKKVKGKRQKKIKD
ncbi:MAG: exodeoxyribonuclease VII large subunit [Candidatus Cloacimonetes bacterium]|nr:exodeoxyribonuclease VII large subunit [Candidatus Cloacimonadota bacterium]